MDITAVRGQKLSSVILDFYECSACHIADRDTHRMDSGYTCPNCGAVSQSGSPYFHIGVISTVDLMQEFYHSSPKAELTKDFSTPSHQLAVVVFFCTMAESLLENLLRCIMDKRDFPTKDQERLLAQNRSTGKRVRKVFPELFGVSWEAAVAGVEPEGPRKYKDALAFAIKAARARNRFLHPPGNKWAIGLAMPRECLQHTPTLLNLFVRLHNRYVAKDPQSSQG